MPFKAIVISSFPFALTLEVDGTVFLHLGLILVALVACKVNALIVISDC